MMFRVVHTVNSLDAAHGGPSRSVTAAADALARAGADAYVLAGGGGREPVSPQAATLELTAPVRAHALLGMSSGYDTSLRRLRPDVVHDHGLWLPSNHAAARSARALGVPLVVSPKGMLSAWSLTHGRLKKRAAWRLFQHRHLERAALIHVTSEEEGEDVRRLGLLSPIALVPHGVSVPAERLVHDGADEKPGTRRALFLSRVHPVKGLPALIQAWGQVRPEGWELVVVGPDEGGHGAQIDALARAARVPLVRHPAADDSQKWSFYRSAELFVLPSHTENFGIAVAEALAAGLPVLTTTGTPWRVVRERKCGWWVEPRSEAIAAALAEATALPPESLRAMGVRGRAYVQATFSWEAVAEQMIAAYRWLGDGGEPPPHVRLR